MKWSKVSSGPQLLVAVTTFLLACDSFASPLGPSSSISSSEIGSNTPSGTRSVSHSIQSSSSVVTSPLPFPSNYPPPFNQVPDATNFVHQSLVSHILTCVYSLFVGAQLLLTSQHLEKVTLGNVTSIYLSGIAWISLLNTDTGMVPPSSSNSPASENDNPVGLGFPSIALILPIHTFGICLSVLSLKINHFRQFAMLLTTVSGGMLFAIQLVLLRPGFLIPLYFPDWLFILAAAFVSGCSLLWFRESTMLVAPTMTGVFFVALGIEVATHRDGGALMGLRVLLDHGLPTTMYQPDRSTRLIMGLFLLLIPSFIYLHYRFGPQNEWPWVDRRAQQLESKQTIQRYTYITFSQLSRSKSDVRSDLSRISRPIPTRPKSVYHKIKKKDISIPLEYVPPTSHFSRDSSDFAHYY